MKRSQFSEEKIIGILKEHVTDYLIRVVGIFSDERSMRMRKSPA